MEAAQLTVPIWEKAVLTVDETVALTGIGRDVIRALAHHGFMHSDMTKIWCVDRRQQSERVRRLYQGDKAALAELCKDEGRRHESHRGDRCAGGCLA